MRLSLAIFLVACSSSAPTSTTPKPAASTPEYDRVRRIVHTFETSPLDPSAVSQEDRTWLVKWLTDTHDVQVIACPDLVGSDDDAKQYAHADLLVAQTLFGEAVFQLDYPSVHSTDERVFEAGLRAAVATYRNILAADASAHWPAFDTIVAMDGSQLTDYVRRTSASCIK
jgi:hypothetical protein